MVGKIMKQIYENLINYFLCVFYRKNFYFFYIMWCNINEQHFPIINVSFNDNNQDEKEFDLFLDKWRDLYDNKNDFLFVFDTRKLALLNIKYAYKMSSFIKELKKRNKQYLKKSIIIVKNKYVGFLLNIVFNITTPVADVYLLSNNDSILIDDIENIKNEKMFNQTIDDYKQHFTIVRSKDSSKKTDKETQLNNHIKIEI